MYSETESTYLDERILTASPVELIQILYDAAVDRVRAARRHLSEGDAMARSHAVSKTLEILSELLLSLNHQESKDSSETYSAIYRHMQRQLLAAHTRQSDSLFAEVEESLLAMAQNWRGIRDMMRQDQPDVEDEQSQPARQAVQHGVLYTADPEPAQASRCWNL